MKDAIGVIGGMGPLASQLFYKMITEHTAAECDQYHVPLLILSDVTMPDRTGAILDGKYDNERIVVIEADKITGDHLGSGGIWLYGGGCDMQYRTFLYGYD